jgi:hypothetical protein
VILTSDGKMFVFGLFSSDGAECESLEGLFEREEDAEARRSYLRATAITTGTPGRTFRHSDECYGDPDLLEVRMLEIAKIIPAEEPREDGER